MKKITPPPEPQQPTIYQIRIKGQLDSQWSDWFSGMAITLDNGDTLMTGQVIDQAALHGLLKKVRDLGLPLVSVVQIQILDSHQNDSKKGKNEHKQQIYSSDE